jgi:hypothetical protein
VRLALLYPLFLVDFMQKKVAVCNCCFRRAESQRSGDCCVVLYVTKMNSKSKRQTHLKCYSSTRTTTLRYLIVQYK